MMKVAVGGAVREDVDLKPAPSLTPPPTATRRH